MDFRFGLKRLLVGVGLAAVPVVAFSGCWPIGTAAGCLAGICLLWLSLVFQRKHVVQTARMLVYQTVGILIVTMICNALTPAGIDYGVSVYVFAIVGASMGAILALATGSRRKRSYKSDAPKDATPPT